MNYRIALYGVRTEGSLADLAACRLTGFRPFEAGEDCSDEPVLTLRFDMDTECDRTGMKILHEFEFEENYAACSFCRLSDGRYLFEMDREASGERATFITDGRNAISDMSADGCRDITLLRFGLWIMFGVAINPLMAVAIHSSVIVKDGGAVLFLGESGTGKSTHTRLWRENIEGAKLLNDDSPIIRFVDGVPTAFGSPWSGKTPCFRNLSFPIRGFVRLSQAPRNRIRRLPVLNAIGALLPSCPPAFAYDDALQDNVCEMLSRMIAKVPVYHLECLPDADAARLSYETVFSNQTAE